MTEWGVVVVVIALAGFVGIFVKISVSLTKALVENTVHLKSVDKSLQSLTTDNQDEHEKFWNKFDEQDTTLNDHEVRISVIENTRAIAPKAQS